MSKSKVTSISITTIVAIIGMLIGVGTWYINSTKAESERAGSTGARVTNLEQTVHRIDQTVEDIRDEQTRQGKDLAAIKGLLEKDQR